MPWKSDLVLLSCVMTEKPQQDSAFDQIRRADEKQFNIQIAADGRWFHDGGEIRRIR